MKRGIEFCYGELSCKNETSNIFLFDEQPLSTNWFPGEDSYCNNSQEDVDYRNFLGGRILIDGEL